MPADRRMARAAANNAEWCDLVCRSNGVPTALNGQAWSATRRPPPLYPDAVTLRKGLPPADLLERVDRTPGCSIKDSFADLDLAPFGFRVLFRAEWIHRTPARAPIAGSGWHVVDTVDDLDAWTTAHGTSGILGPALLEDPAVRFLAVRDEDRVVGGAVANRSEDVVGVSNVFGTDDHGAAGVWAGIPGAVAACFPGLPLVGYEHGDDLAAAVDAGFAAVGPLQIWLHPAAADR